MKRLSLVLLTSLALGGVALAEDKAATSGSDKSNSMSGTPNADGAAKKDSGSDTGGNSGGGAAAAKSTGEADGSSKK